MFIQQLTDYDIKEISDILIKQFNLRRNKATIDHTFEIDKTDNNEYELTIARYEEFNQYRYVTRELCHISDFNFISDNAFLKQKDLTIEYTKFMYKKFGEKYLNALKEHLINKRRTKLNEYKKELENNDIDMIDELCK